MIEADTRVLMGGIIRELWMPIGETGKAIRMATLTTVAVQFCKIVHTTLMF